jgi:hypothetical protein
VLQGNVDQPFADVTQNLDMGDWSCKLYSTDDISERIPDMACAH